MKKPKKTGHSLKALPKGTWNRQLAKACDAYLPSISNTLAVKSLWKRAMRKKKASAPKTVAVWGFTWKRPTQRVVYVTVDDDGAQYRTKRQADAERRRLSWMGVWVGPAVKLTLPEPKEPR